MVLDLTRLFENEGEELLFSHSLDLSSFEQSGIHPLLAPVKISGKAQNTAGIVTLSYTARYTLDMPCDRCLTPVTRQRVLKSSTVAVRRLENEEHDDYLVLPDAVVNLDELVFTDLVLELPSKNLCGENCKGLCPECGANRNIAPCTCPQTAGDPRLRALRELLEQ